MPVPVGAGANTSGDAAEPTAGHAETAPAGGPAASDPLEITAVGAGGSTPSPDDSGPTLAPGDTSRRFGKKVMAIPRPTRPTPGGMGSASGLKPLGDAAAAATKSGSEETSRHLVQVAPGIVAAPESVPEGKNAAFISTIVGVPPVEIGGPAIPVSSSWMRPLTAGEGTPGSGGSESSAITFTSVPSETVSAAPERDVDDGMLTERNAAAPAYGHSGPVGFSGSTSFSDGGSGGRGGNDGTSPAVGGPRITARLGLSAPAPVRRRTVVVALAGGIAVVALCLALFRRSPEDDRAANRGVKEGQQHATSPVPTAPEPPKISTTAAAAEAPAPVPPPAVDPQTAPPPPETAPSASSPAPSAAIPSRLAVWRPNRRAVRPFPTTTPPVPIRAPRPPT